MAILFGMARTTVKATYSLPPQVIRRLEQLAAAWKVSKSEALARAISEATTAGTASAPHGVLDALQREAADLSARECTAWSDMARRERERLERDR